MGYRDRSGETRQKLVRAAAAVFDHRGFGAANLQDVCAKAGVTKGALYFHFSSKDSLAVAVMEEQSKVWRTALRRVGVDGVPAMQSLVDLSYSVGELLRVDPVTRAATLLMFESGLFRRQAGPQFAGWITVVRALLRQARADGDVWPHLDLRAEAESLVSGFSGMHLMSRALTGHRDVQRRTDLLWRVWAPGLVPPERRGRLRFGPPAAAG